MMPPGSHILVNNENLNTNAASSNRKAEKTNNILTRNPWKIVMLSASRLSPLPSPFPIGLTVSPLTLVQFHCHLSAFSRKIRLAQSLPTTTTTPPTDRLAMPLVTNPKMTLMNGMLWSLPYAKRNHLTAGVSLSKQVKF